MTAPQPIVIGLGELLWDNFPNGRRPGGAPANVAYHAGLLGLRGLICSRVGGDADGDALVAHLQARGLTTRFIQRDPQRPTGVVDVKEDRDQGPAYTIRDNAAWDGLELTPQWSSMFVQAAAVSFGTLAQRSASNRETTARALEAARHALRVYDVNLRPPFYRREWIEASLRPARVVKLNDQEVGVVGPLLGLPAGTPARFGQALLERYGGEVVCVTRGAEGCVLVTASETVAVPSQPVKVVDTVGAGDAFTAALIYGLLHGWPLRTCGAFANAGGGLIASRAGAMPDVRAEWDALRAAFG